MSNDFESSLYKLQEMQKRPDGITKREWHSIQKGVKELKNRKDAPFDPKKHKAQTQSNLANAFIKYYFWTIVFVLLYALGYNWAANSLFNGEQLNVKDVFMMVSSAITPILAFVLGHYFKGRD